MGEGLGIKTTALLTRMDNPMGRNIGNALEVVEAIECLNGGGPADLVGLTCQLGKLNIIFPVDFDYLLNNLFEQIWTAV